MSTKSKKATKSKKMDRKLVASKEKTQSEVNYISSKYKIPRMTIRGVIRLVGISRKKIYEELRQMGYNIPSSKKKK